MITAKFTLNWQGGEYSQRLHRELVRATRQSAERVKREAVKLLSVSGQAAVTPTGLNRVKGKGSRELTTTQKNYRIKHSGIAAMTNLKFVKSNKTGASLVFGGSHKGVDRIYWNNSTRKWTTSSPPGSPPHKQSGRLHEIAVQTIMGGLRAKIGPQNGLKYARVQELGGKALINLPPRPYMRPAFVSQEQAILFQFALAVQRAAK